MVNVFGSRLSPATHGQKTNSEDSENPTTDSCLRSPNIDLTGVTAAELTFAEALDLETGDSTLPKLFNAADDQEIAPL